jgi:hypothetical protein
VKSEFTHARRDDEDPEGDRPMSERHMQIGEVAEGTSLSLRSIRYYEEVRLVPPSARTQGGFRLHTEADIERLIHRRRRRPTDPPAGPTGGSLIRERGPSPV